MNLRATLALSALLLAGCTGAIRPDADPRQAQARWQERRPDLERIEQFTLVGRVSSGFGLKGDLRWKQTANERFEVRMAGPFGMRAVSLTGDPGLVEVRAGDTVEYTDDPEAWVHKRLGWTFPLRGLRWWVLGLPSPHSPATLEFDDHGRITALEQDGWHLQYAEYRAAGERELPRLLDAGNGQVKIRLLADRWEDLSSP